MKGLLLLFIALTAGPGLQRVDHNKAGLSDRCIERLDSTINQAIADTVFPGAVVAVVRHDKLAYIKAYGERAVDPVREPMTEDTMFDLASLSKPVSTATATLQLCEKGELSLSDKVAEHIPGFAPYEGREGRCRDARKITVPITLRHLMLHSSGLPSYIAVDNFVSSHDSTHEAMLEYIAKEAPRKNKPGTKRVYSCLNYITLQEIIERCTGDSLCNWSERNVFKVLGMENTRYFPGGAPDELLPGIAPTERQEDSTFIRGRVHDPLAWKLGGGNSGNAGVFSTANDLSIFCAALLNGGALYRHPGGRLDADRNGRECRILSEQSVRLLYTVDPQTGRTYGWDSESPSADFKGTDFGNGRIICHTGFTGPSIVIDFKSGTAIILLCSRLHPQDRSVVKWPHAMLGDVRTEVSDIIAESVRNSR